MRTEWPKAVPELTADQRRIQDDWMRYWLETLPDRHGRIEAFNHQYPLRQARPGGRTLEIGAGLGGHIRHEDTAGQEYHALELRPDLAEALRAEFPEVQTVVSDCQETLPFPDDYFDRALAIHVLEHLPNLPAALDEIRRVLRPGGLFSIVIPCEGGLGYAIGRKLTVKRTFEKRYGTDYEWHIKSEHLSVPSEIFAELRCRFSIVDRTFFPLRIPSVHLNLLIGITAVKGANKARRTAPSR